MAMEATLGRIATLEPDFQKQVVALLNDLEGATGRKWGVSDGRRTLAEQRRIYAQGRTTPGKVVTRAQPGESAHNFGYAVDLCPLTKSGNDFDWDAPKSVFKKMADMAKARGLDAGYYFKSIFDAPHVESPKWRESQKLWQAGKLHVA